MNRSAGRPQVSRSHTSTCGTPRKRGNKMASGPRRSHTTRMASHDKRASRCDPAHRSSILRALAMKGCTGPMESVSKAASPCGSAAKAPAKALVRSRWSQMEWSGIRVSAGSSFHSSPRVPLSLSSRNSGPKRHMASKVRLKSVTPSWRCSSEERWVKARALTSSKSVSVRPPCRPRSKCAPVSGCTRTGFLAQFTRAQSATPRVFSSPFLVVTEISRNGHCGLSAAAAHQSARCTVL